MLVSELKKVIEIDSRITGLHQELATLYVERQKYIEQTATPGRSVIEGSPLSIQSADTGVTWLQTTYNQLSEAWSAYDVKIPALRQLKKPLVKASLVISNLSKDRPELAGRLTILLVPPVHILGQPVDNKHRQSQTFVNLDDYFGEDLIKRYQQKKWRMLVVYDDQVPLNFGKASELLAAKSYMIGGYDIRGLGVYEYFALSLQSPRPLDRHTWTLLLKGTRALAKTVTSVTFINGQYRFEVDDTDGVFGDERFRPAVDIADI